MMTLQDKVALNRGTLKHDPRVKASFTPATKAVIPNPRPPVIEKPEPKPQQTSAKASKKK